MTFLDQIKEVMADHKGSAHVNDIAQMLIERFPNLPIQPDKIPSKVSSTLASDVKKKSSKSSFSKIKNKNGSFKKGLYRLKKKQKTVIKPTPTLSPNVSNQYTGKAGETAVISELLFYGYNASGMAVDDGIDVIAGKDNKYFHIQVKTANKTEAGAFSFTIKKSSFVSKHSFQTFYIFVIRQKDDYRYYNDYLILPSSQIKLLIDSGTIKDGKSLFVKIQTDKIGRYILNAKQDVTISINRFSQLA